MHSDKPKKQWSYYLLLGLLFLLPWQTRFIYAPGSFRGQYFEYATQSLFATQLLLGLTILVFLIERFADSRFRAMLRSRWHTHHAHRHLAVFAVFLGYCAWQVKTSSYGAIVQEKLFCLLMAACLGALVYVFHNNYRALVAAFWLGAVGQGVLGAAQFFTQTVVANKWLGIASHNGKDLGAFVVEFGIERWLRAYGAFGSPNMLGGFLAVALVLGLWLYVTAPLSFKKIGFLLGDLAIIIGLTLSFSRAAWAAAAVGIAAFIVHLIATKQYTEKKLEVAKFILYSCLMVGFLVAAYKPLFTTRISGTARLEVQSNTARKGEYRTFVNVFKKHWLFGTGPGLYPVVLGEQNPKQPVWQLQPMHNSVLLFVAEWGVLGTLVLLGALWLMGLHTAKPFWPLGLTLLVSLCLDHFWLSLYGGLALLAPTVAFVFLYQKTLVDNSTKAL